MFKTPTGSTNLIDELLKNVNIFEKGDLGEEIVKKFTTMSETFSNKNSEIPGSSNPHRKENSNFIKSEQNYNENVQFSMENNPINSQLNVHTGNFTQQNFNEMIVSSQRRQESIPLILKDKKNDSATIGIEPTSNQLEIRCKTNNNNVSSSEDSSDDDDRTPREIGWTVPPPLPPEIPPHPPRPPHVDISSYLQKKSMAQGMMDLALLSANTNQLRYVLDARHTQQYFIVSVSLIIISLILQITVGLSLIWNSRVNFKKKNEVASADKVNNLSVILVFLITIINVFISTFGGSSQNGSSGTGMGEETSVEEDAVVDDIPFESSGE